MVTLGGLSGGYQVESFVGDFTRHTNLTSALGRNEQSNAPLDAAIDREAGTGLPIHRPECSRIHLIHFEIDAEREGTRVG